MMDDGWMMDDCVRESVGNVGSVGEWESWRVGEDLAYKLSSEQCFPGPARS